MKLLMVNAWVYVSLNFYLKVYCVFFFFFFFFYFTLDIPCVNQTLNFAAKSLVVVSRRCAKKKFKKKKRNVWNLTWRCKATVPSVGGAKGSGKWETQTYTVCQGRRANQEWKAVDHGSCANKLRSHTKLVK